MELVAKTYQCLLDLATLFNRRSTDEAPANVADASAVVAPGISDRLEVGRQAAGRRRCFAMRTTQTQLRGMPFATSCR